MKMHVKKFLFIAYLMVLICAPANFTYAIGGGGPVTVIGGPGSSADIKTAVESTLSAAQETLQTGLMNSLHIKELTLDGIAFGLAKTLLKGVTNSILNWINSGFQGSPAFITDMEGFLVDLADQTAGEFIYGSDLRFLCSPFQLNVRIALDVQYRQQRDYQPICTLSDVSDNIEGFLAGNFADGGWPAWFEITQNPYNNPTGAYLGATGQLGIELETAEGIFSLGAFKNGNFLNVEVCEPVADAYKPNEKKCTVTTPGHVIAEQLSFNLDSGRQALIEADEINEIIGALFAQLAQQAITGVNGLLGMAGGGGGGGASTRYDFYNDDGSRLTNSTFGQTGEFSYADAILEEDVLVTTERGDIAGIQNNIDTSREFAAKNEEILQIIDRALSRYQRAIDNNPGCFTDSREASLGIDDDLEYFLETAESAAAAIATSQNNTQALIDTRSAFTLSGSSTARQLVINRFMDDFQSDQFITQASVVEVDLFITFDLDPRVEEFDASIAEGISNCLNTGP